MPVLISLRSAVKLMVSINGTECYITVFRELGTLHLATLIKASIFFKFKIHLSISRIWEIFGKYSNIRNKVKCELTEPMPFLITAKSKSVKRLLSVCVFSIYQHVRTDKMSMYIYQLTWFFVWAASLSIQICNKETRKVLHISEFFFSTN